MHELRSLDYRDLILLYNEAQRKSIEVALNNASIYRVAQAKKEDYQRVMTEMKEQMNKLQMGSKKSIKDSWQNLKRRG